MILLTCLLAYARTSPDVISFEATIEDPIVWKISMPLYRRQEKNAQLDFKSVEFVEELLYGQYRKRPLN